MLVLYYGFGLFCGKFILQHACRLSKAGCTEYKHRALCQGKAEAEQCKPHPGGMGAVSQHKPMRPPGRSRLRGCVRRHILYPPKQEEHSEPPPNIVRVVCHTFSLQRLISVTSPPSIVRFEWRRGQVTMQGCHLQEHPISSYL